MKRKEREPKNTNPKAKPQATYKIRKLAVRSDVLTITEVHPNYNSDISSILFEMAEIEKNQGQKHKYLAYITAASSLAAYPKRVESGETAQHDINGVGKKIACKIQEILDTGKLRKLETYKNDEKIQALNRLCKVTGVGPAAARKWIESGIRTVEELKTQKLNHHQQVGVKYFEDFQKRIPRAEMEELTKIMKDAIKELDPQVKAKCCGSYRRGAAHSGDIDFLITHPKFDDKQKENKNTFDLIQNIVQKLHEIHFLVDDISVGQHQYMGVCKLPKEDAVNRRIDLKLFPVESFYTALLHFTGSSEHNRQLSCIAINKGFKLNEYSLIPIGSTGVEGNPLPVTTEKDIYAMLGIPYRKPSERSV